MEHSRKLESVKIMPKWNSVLDIGSIFADLKHGEAI